MKKHLLTLLILCLGLAKAQTIFNHNWSAGFGDATNNDQMGGSVIDASGNLYISGRMDGVVDFDPTNGVVSHTASTKPYIAKYDINGALVWVNVMTGGGVAGTKCMDIDANGNIYICGYLQSGDMDFNPQAPGIFTVAPNFNDMFIAKYNSNGACQWVKHLGQLSTNVEPVDMKVTPSGSIHITGYFNMAMDFDPGVGVTTLTSNPVADIFVLKLNTSGNFVWAFSIGDSGADAGYGIDVNAAGEVALTGQIQNTVDIDPGITTSTIASEGAEDLFIAKYSSVGTLIWGGSMGGTVKDLGTTVEFLSNGDLLLGGLIQSASIDIDPTVGTNTVAKAGVIGGSDLYIGKINGSTGASIYGKLAGVASATPGDIILRDIAQDGPNKFYITGSFQETVNFDLNGGTSTLQAIGIPGDDVFIAQYDLSNANLLYRYQMGATGVNTGNEAAQIHVKGNDVYLAGEHRHPLDMDPGAGTASITAYGGTDFFIAKYTQCTLPTLASYAQSTNAVCAGSSVSLSITGGTLNSAPNWSWYKGACGGTLVGTGTLVVDNPTITTTYFVKGDGGCVPNGGTCVNTTVNATPLTNINGTVTSNTITPVAVSGQILLFKYETNLNKFDTIAKQTLGVNGDYNMVSVPSGSYIMQAIPNSNSLIPTYAPNKIGWKDAQIFFHGCSVNATKNINVVELSNFGVGPGMFTGKIVEGLKYGQKGAVVAPGSPIKGISVKGGRNPGGNIGSQDRTLPNGSYTLSGLPNNVGMESYFVYVDIQGLDTNGTYHKVVMNGSSQYFNLDFIVDSAKIHPAIFVGINENVIEKKNLKVWPNPSSGQMFIGIEMERPSYLKVELFDVMGKLVSEIYPEAMEESKQLTIISDNSKIPAGVYFLKVKVGDVNSVTRIVITN